MLLRPSLRFSTGGAQAARGPWPVLPATDSWPLFQSTALRRHEAAALAATAPQALMQRAGAATARLALALAPHARRVWVAAGPGNNGGDGVEAALHLLAAGRQVCLSAAARPTGAGPEDARQAWARAAAAGLSVSDEFPATLGPKDLIIDALLGLGAQRPLQGRLSEAAEHMMALRASCGVPILAIDLPSGLDADRGCWPPLGPRLRADHTLSLLGLKTGHFTADGRDACGRVWFDDLGMPPDAADAQAWLVGADIVDALPARAHAQHKGSFGQVWVIGGAPGMQGAAHLAAAAALQVGAGRVHLAALDGQATLPAAWPELMPCTPQAALDAARAARDRKDAHGGGQDVWVAGCGGGTDIAPLLPELLDSAPRLLLDADALNALAASAALQLALRRRADRGEPTVLTPHPLEAARLLGCSTQDLQSDRLGRAQALAERDQVHVVLKGSGTVTTAPGARPAINGSGHAALATAGSGDVLGGLIGGLWAQGLAPLEAARLAVWRHGRVAELSGRARLRASDLLQA